MNIVRLSSASLEIPINDPNDRSEMPMSTLIASDKWLLETSWDGASIGDVQIFKNAKCDVNGNALRHIEGKKKGQKVDPEWIWWGGVPRGKIKSYRFLDGANIRPATVEDVGMPFELPNAQRKEEPRPTREGGPAPA